jgi:hypothetical protein
MRFIRVYIIETDEWPLVCGDYPYILSGLSLILITYRMTIANIQFKIFAF